jgi:hypothetical protein
MTVAYCPTAFTSAGALIQVDPQAGSWKILRKFQWPSQINQQGCLALDDPAMLYDSKTNNIYFDFTELFGLLVELNVRTRNIFFECARDLNCFFCFYRFKLEPLALFSLMRPFSLAL